MKIIKTKKYAQLQEVSYQTIFDNALRKNNGDEKEAAEVVLDIATGGTWAVWDQERINQAIEKILSQFVVRKIKGVPLKGYQPTEPYNSRTTGPAWNDK